MFLRVGTRVLFTLAWSVRRRCRGHRGAASAARLGTASFHRRLFRAQAFGLGNGACHALQFEAGLVTAWPRRAFPESKPENAVAILAQAGWLKS